MRTEEFEYPLDPDRIAQTPIEPRDHARLLDTRDLSDHHFYDLPQLLQPGDLVVVNRSRVRASRLVGHKQDSPGKVEALLLGPVTGDLWRALIKPARRLRTGQVLEFGEITATIVESPDQGVVLLDLAAEVDLEGAIARIGHVPLPPYITTDLPDPERYQTIFSRELGSAAAPTAGLHFTEEVRAALGERGIAWAEVDLQIGLDTFRPIAATEIEDHQIHTERVSVPEETRDAIAGCEGRVVAIGTTVVRALESAPGTEATDLYITPGFRFRQVDLLVTNFHLPRTSLLVLLAAFMGEKWRDAYRTAIDRGYRFASFGDAMLASRG